MKYTALIEKLNSNIEEEVTVNVNGIVLTGFAAICPYIIEVGQQYTIRLGLTILDEVEIKEISEPILAIENVGQGYAYYIRGELQGRILDASLLFEDDFFLEYGYLDGKYIELYIDRLSIEFL